ncbi:hypothetical protein HZA75_04245 [Candidatus Roizmanbacteria bacterium]|nr:hypothetical protein [Candidatus Roizmanbacteria bacterium]
MDDFFSFISKTVIIIPIAVVIISLFLKFNQPKTGLINQTTTEVQTPKLGVSTKNNNFKFDFKGPYKCSYKDDKIEAKIYIKNKNVLAEVNKDGEIKKYLLSPYVSIVENMLNSNFSGIENMASQYMKRKIDIKEILNSCKKEDFNEKIFNLK